jgi:DNA-binding response OmpR family regulator
MPKTVFVIDDDVSLQAMLEIALRQAGYHAEFASDGEEALQRLETMQPDMLLCDVMMPEMDGVQFFEAIRERLRYEGIPIIIMTALTRRAWFVDLEAEGAVFIQKPFEVDHLLGLIDLHVND